jgi:heat-inducible transcriptional repressor
MESEQLTPSEKELLKDELDRIVGDTEELLTESSRVLSSLTNLLGVVLTPKLSTGVLERLEIVKLSSSRAMFIISVSGSLVRTIVLRAAVDVPRSVLDQVVSVLNERLAGLSLKDIRETFSARVADLVDDVTGIVQLTLQESDQLFGEIPEADRVKYGGAQNLMFQPEFREAVDLRTLMELIEDRNSVVSLIEDPRLTELTGVGEAAISIGTEHGDDEPASRYSIVAARYQLGDSVGTVGVIGPKRMNYGRVVSVVEGMAALISEYKINV